MEIQTTSNVAGGGVVMDLGGRKVLIPARIAATVLDAQWAISFDIRADPQTGKFVTTKITIEEKPDGPGVEAAVTRELKFGEAKKLAIERAALPVTLTESEDGNSMMISITSDNAALPVGVGEAALKPRRQPVTMHELQEYAAAYLDAQTKPGDKLAQVAKAMRKSRATAARRIDRARSLGLLLGEDTK